MMKQIEILAPAGSYDSMRAAMNAGCDAVYIGGASFGARAYADNPDEDTLLRAIDEAHLRNKKLYLTVNTLIKEEEMADRLYGYLEKYYLEGLDAVIVQDIGVMRFIHRHFPKLSIHASTQTTITMAQGAELLKGEGVSRLVTARELSIPEIRRIREGTDLEIETFVHGSLCYCYSGQCLMSSMIGGRSGNRGRCAQPCRMPYQFVSGRSRISSDREKYLLSPKDINTIALIPELVEAGIDSFKIEGRMKRAEYAAGVSAVYRKYTDLYLEHGRDAFERYMDTSSFEQDMNDLMDLYNRGGFSYGYGKTYHGKKMMSLYCPSHSGVPVGEVSKIMGSRAIFELTKNVNAQDILEIRTGEGEAVFEFTAKDAGQRGEIQKVNVGKGTRIRKIAGAKVYRTRNNRLLSRIASDYLEKDLKLGIKGSMRAVPGEQLLLTLKYNEISVTAAGDIVQLAKNQPICGEKLSAPIGKLGDTPYFLTELTVEDTGNAFVPVMKLNELRRNAVQQLTDAVLRQYKRKETGLREDPDGIMSNVAGDVRAADAIIKRDPDTQQLRRETGEAKTEICVSVCTMEQFREVLPYCEIASVYAEYEGFGTDMLLEIAEDAKKSGKGFYVILPHIVRALVYDKLYKDIALLWNSPKINGFIVRNFEEAAILTSFPDFGTGKKEIILNHNMYIFNRQAKEFWKDRGIYHYTAPLEQNSNELKTLKIYDCDLLVYGYLPLMVSVQCLYENTQGCRRCKQGETRRDYLIDRLGKRFYVQTNCSGCYNIIYNGQCLSLLKHRKEIESLAPRNVRLGFTFENAAETKQILTAFIGAFVYGREPVHVLSGYTTGHFKRGVE